MAYPYAKKVELPELGPGDDGEPAWLLLENPWNLPRDKPFPRNIIYRLPEDDETDAERRIREKHNEETAEERAAEIDRRSRHQLKLLVLDWHGIRDLETGEELVPPRQDETVIDRMPQIVNIKVLQSVGAMEPDEEWDPTKRPEKPPEQTETKAEPSAPPTSNDSNDKPSTNSPKT